MPCDFSRYPKNWKTKIRPDILERDGHKCKDCGVPNYAIGARDLNGKWHFSSEINSMNSDVGYSYFGGFDYKEIKIVLTIAHLDHDHENNDYSNLAALCQKCHLLHDREQHMENSRTTRERKKGLQRLF